MAVNCCVAPFGMDGLVGVTAIELKVGAIAFTVSVVVPVTDPDAA